VGAGAVTVHLLVLPEALAGETVNVGGEPYRHLFRARRLAVGDRLRLADGRGAARWATVASVDRREARLTLGEAAPANDPARRLTLLVAPPRPERTAWLVEKATELGVAAIRFLAAERAVRGLDGRALGRLARVAAAALEQCGGATLPELSGPHPLAALPGLLAAGGEAFYLHPVGTAALPAAGAAPVAVLVGPEGGWSDAELAALAASGARPAALGTRILRVETAAVAAAARLLPGSA
jgi:16S rRNA (uracil1498-N3)-methyltransferase